MIEQTPNKSRLSIVVAGARLRRIHQVMKINGFESETEACQYLVNRGLEACSPNVRQWEMLKELQEQTSASSHQLFLDMADTVKHDLKGA